MTKEPHRRSDRPQLQQPDGTLRTTYARLLIRRKIIGTDIEQTDALLRSGWPQACHVRPDLAQRTASRTFYTNPTLADDDPANFFPSFSTAHLLSMLPPELARNGKTYACLLHPLPSPCGNTAARQWEVVYQGEEEMPIICAQGEIHAAVTEALLLIASVTSSADCLGSLKK